MVPASPKAPDPEQKSPSKAYVRIVSKLAPPPQTAAHSEQHAHHELPVLVVVDGFVQRLADSMHDSAVDLAIQ